MNQALPNPPMPVLAREFADPTGKQFPDAVVWMDARYWLSDATIRMSGPVGAGLLIERVASKAMDGAVDDSIEWIHRVVRNGSRPGIAQSIRRDVLAAGECAYCGDTERLEVDHIKPWSKGGTHTRTNLQALCCRCNRIKGAS